MKIKIRKVWVSFRVKADEKAYLRREADERDQRLSDYCRAQLLANAPIPATDENNKCLTRS